MNIKRPKIAWSVPWAHEDPHHWFKKRDSFQESLVSLTEPFDVYVVALHKRRADRVLHKNVNYWFCRNEKELVAALVELQPDLVNYWGYACRVNRLIDRALPGVPKTVYPVGAKLLFDDMAHVERFFVSTDQDRRRVHEHPQAGCYPHSQVVVCPFTAPSSVLPKDQDADGERYDVVYVSGWRQLKRQGLLLQALPQITFGRVAFIGPRDEPVYFEKWLPRLRQEYGGGYVELIDAVPPRAVLGYLRESKVAVQLSQSEGGSRVLLEALACGVPLVVCNDCRVNSEQVRHGITGLVVDPTPAAVAAAINGLLADADLRRRIGRQAAEATKAQRHTAPMAKIFEREFRRLLAEWK